MEGLDELMIKAVRETGTRSNLKEVDLDGYGASPEAMLARRLEALPNESNRDFPLSFDPVQAIFIDKLISEDALRKPIKVKREDFFRGAVLMDYASSVFFGRHDVIEAISKRGKEMELANPEYDITIADIAREIGSYYLTRSGFYERGADEKSSQRYESLNARADITGTGLRRVSPIYDSLARIVLGLVNNPILRESLPMLEGRYDLKAAIFTDCALEIIPDAGDQRRVMEQFQKGDYYKATLIGMLAMSNRYPGSSGASGIGAAQGYRGAEAR